MILPSNNPAVTSLIKCAPRIILEIGTAIIAKVAITVSISFLLITKSNAKKNNATKVEWPLGKLKPWWSSGNGLTLWILYLNAAKKNPPKPALKNINTAFLSSFIQTKNPVNKIIINNNNLSLKTSDIILAICPKAFISSKSAIILSKSLFGNFIATTANAMKTNIRSEERRVGKEC